MSTKPPMIIAWNPEMLIEHWKAIRAPKSVVVAYNGFLQWCINQAPDYQPNTSPAPKNQQ